MEADTPDEARLVTKLRTLPPAKQAEVEDFVDFLRDRAATAALTNAAARTSEASFAEVWSNEDDAVYDGL